MDSGGPLMLVIPAIDLRGGRCVRLRQGRAEEETVFSDDPVAMAGRWVSAGARRLHMVDLDGAFAGEPVNAEVIQAVTRRWPRLPVQVGGGIRSLDSAAAYLEAGVAYVVVGSRALTEPDFVAQLCRSFPGQVMVGLDVRQGRLAAEGWVRLSDTSAAELARRLAAVGVAAFIHTVIERDGMMDGVDWQATATLARGLEVPVIASGGVRGMKDLEALMQVARTGIAGVISGRALYEGRLDLAQAQQWCDAHAAGTVAEGAAGGSEADD